MESDGQFLSCNLMSSVVGLVGIEIRARVYYERDFIRSHRNTKSKHPIGFNFFLTFSNPISLPTAYSPALICFGRERGWWITCNYPTVLKEKIIEKQEEYYLRYLLSKVRTT
jgi:hypothetical protein